MSDWGSGGDGVVQLLVDQIEELIVTVIEEVRTRPSVAAAIVAGVVGAVVGITLARRGTRRRPPRVSAGNEILGEILGSLVGGMPRARDFQRTTTRSGKRVQQRLGDVSDLASLGVRLLENPIVRSYVRAAIASQVRKRFGR